MNTQIMGNKESANSGLVVFLVVVLVFMILFLSVLSSIIINSYLLSKEQRHNESYNKVGQKNKISIFLLIVYSLFTELPCKKIKSSQPSGPT